MIQDDTLHSWFVRDILPLERGLTGYIRRNWRTAEDVLELRQDIYERALTGARRGIPSNSRAYLYTVARNHLINQSTKSQIVSIEAVADLDTVDRSLDLFEAERVLDARDKLRLAQTGIDKLPPKCREIVILQKVKGFTDREAAEILGVSVETVRRQIKLGMKALIDHMLGGSGRIVRSDYRARKKRVKKP